MKPLNTQGFLFRWVTLTIAMGALVYFLMIESLVSALFTMVGVTAVLVGCVAVSQWAGMPGWQFEFMLFGPPLMLVGVGFLGASLGWGKRKGKRNFVS